MGWGKGSLVVALALGLAVLAALVGLRPRRVAREALGGTVERAGGAAAPEEHLPPARPLEPEPLSAPRDAVVPSPSVRISGTVRVGTPEDSARLRAPATIRIAWDDGPASLEARAENGSFAVDLPSGVREARVVAIVAQDGVALVLGVGRMLRAGADARVYGVWPERRVRFTVLGADDGRELDALDVRRLGDEGGGGDAPNGGGAGRDVPGELVLRAVPSPLTLTIPTAAEGSYRIEREGYLPFVWRFPVAAPSDQVLVRLRPAGGLEVWIDGAPEPDDRTRVYPRNGMPDFFTEPLRELAASPHATIRGLAPGGYTVTVERAWKGDRADEPTDVVLARSDVELTAGGHASVRLAPAELADVLRPGSVTLRFPADLPPGSEASLSALSRNADRVPGPSFWNRAVGPGESSGPLALVPGSYQLSVRPAHRRVFFDVAPGEELALDVPACRPYPFVLTFVDAATGDAVAPSTIRWSAPSDARGSFLLPPADLNVVVESVGDPVRLSAPLARIDLSVTLEDGCWERVQLDLSDGRDRVVPLHVCGAIGIEIDGLDERLDERWLYGVELVSGDDVRRPRGVEQGGEDGRATLRFASLPSGAVTLRFPPLPSYGELRDRALTLEAGETPLVRIGPADCATTGAPEGH